MPGSQGQATAPSFLTNSHVEKYNLIPRNIELVVVLVNYANYSLSSKV